MTTTNQFQEEILNKTNDRFVLFPIKYNTIWDFYKRAEASIWHTAELNLNDDLNDWNNKLNDDERHFISHVLAFFAASDGIVNENLVVNFMQDVAIPEARCFYGMQVAIENIHSETYSLLIDTYISNEVEKNKLFNAIETIPCVQKKANWALKWIEKSSSFAERLIAFAAVEGIFFSGSFCSIYWLNSKGLMKGLSHSNELISKDEWLHCDFACLLYSMLQNKLTDKTIYSIISEAVEYEKEFVSDALPVSLIGMNAKEMCNHIEYMADFLLQNLGLKPLYNTPNPFVFMDLIALRPKTNFFENKVGEYSKAGVGSSTESNEVRFDEDF